LYAAVLKSPSVNLFLCFIFMRHTIVKEIFPPLWGVHPYGAIKGGLIALIQVMWQANPIWGSPASQAQRAKLHMPARWDR
jgi:hypothetical protein